MAHSLWPQNIPGSSHHKWIRIKYRDCYNMLNRMDRLVFKSESPNREDLKRELSRLGVIFPWDWGEWPKIAMKRFLCLLFSGGSLKKSLSMICDLSDQSIKANLWAESRLQRNNTQTENLAFYDGQESAKKRGREPLSSSWSRVTNNRFRAKSLCRSQKWSFRSLEESKVFLRFHAFFNFHLL